MAVHTIGELVNRVLSDVEELAWIHTQLRPMPDASQRKQHIMRARELGRISPRQAELLIQAYQLETA